MSDTEPTREEHFCESCISDEEPFCTEHTREIREEYIRKNAEPPCTGPTREEHIRGIREEEKPFSSNEEEEEEEGTLREGDQERKRKRGAKYE